MNAATDPDLQLIVAAAPENVAVVRHAFGGLADALRLGEQAANDLKLAVTEACTNVVVHAYRDATVAAGSIEVDATVGADALTVVVRDFGPGVTPRADSPGLGLGLPMIASLTQALEVVGGGADAPTEVRMTFGLDREEPAA